MAIHIILRPRDEYIALRNERKAADRAVRRWTKPTTWPYEAKAIAAFVGLTVGAPLAISGIASFLMG